MRRAATQLCELTGGDADPRCQSAHDCLKRAEEQVRAHCPSCFLVRARLELLERFLKRAGLGQAARDRLEVGRVDVGVDRHVAVALIEDRALADRDQGGGERLADERLEAPRRSSFRRRAW